MSSFYWIKVPTSVLPYPSSIQPTACENPDISWWATQWLCYWAQFRSPICDLAKAKFLRWVLSFWFRRSVLLRWFRSSVYGGAGQTFLICLLLSSWVLPFFIAREIKNRFIELFTDLWGMTVLISHGRNRKLYSLDRNWAMNCQREDYYSQIPHYDVFRWSDDNKWLLAISWVPAEIQPWSFSICVRLF